MTTRCFCYGTFDIIHGGSLRFLQWASGLAGSLVVGIPSDSSPGILCDYRPILDHFQRAEVLLSLRMVSDVYMFDEDTPVKLIRNIKPEVLALSCHQQLPGVGELSQTLGMKVFTSPDFRSPLAHEIFSNLVLRDV